MGGVPWGLHASGVPVCLSAGPWGFAPSLHTGMVLLLPSRCVGTGLVARAGPCAVPPAGSTSPHGTGRCRWWAGNHPAKRCQQGVSPPCHPKPLTSKPGDLSNAAALARGGETHSWGGSRDCEGGSVHPWAHWRDGATPPLQHTCMRGCCSVGPKCHHQLPTRGRSLCPGYSQAGLPLLPGLWSGEPWRCQGQWCARSLLLWHLAEPCWGPRGSAGGPVPLALLCSEPWCLPHRAGSRGRPRDGCPMNNQQQKHIKARPDGSE